MSLERQIKALRREKRIKILQKQELILEIQNLNMTIAELVEELEREEKAFEKEGLPDRHVNAAIRDQ